MTISRRTLLKGAAGVAGLQLLAPVVGRTGAAFGRTVADPATAARRRLLLIVQHGGSDGLNVVVPRADVAGAARYSVYRKARPSIGFKPEALHPLDLGDDAGHALGLNPALRTVADMYSSGRVAVVQGVDYPGHSFSHFTSQDIWESGFVDQAPSSGWIGRHLDRAGIGEAELRAVGVGTQLPLSLQGEQQLGAGIASIPATRFADGTAGVARARHEALARFGHHRTDDPVRHAVGRISASTVAVVENLQTTKVPPTVAGGFIDQLTTARLLLEDDRLGVEVVVLVQYGYDTHTNAVSRHQALLSTLDDGMDLFWNGMYKGVRKLPPLRPSLASKMLVMTSSEFGRRVRENTPGATAGVDHGGAAPVLLMTGPGSSLVGGIHGEHPGMGTTLAPADNLEMTTDVRRLYQSVLSGWMGDPDPRWGQALSPLPGLFR